MARTAETAKRARMVLQPKKTITKKIGNMATIRKTTHPKKPMRTATATMAAIHSWQGMSQCKDRQTINKECNFPEAASVSQDGTIVAGRMKWPVHPGLKLQLEPSRSSSTQSKSVTSRVLRRRNDEKCKKKYWNTPRHGKTDGSKTLTARSERDLPTTVYFETNTPFMKTGVMNPDWLDWLQGFPTGFSSPDGVARRNTIAYPTAKPSRKLNCLDVFTGIGGIALGLHPWCKSAGYCDIDAHARRTIAARIGDGSLDKAPIFDDITALDQKSFKNATGLSTVDMLAGGFPCVGISRAGNEQGLNNDQSSLYHHMVRLIDELDVNAVFLENVSNITGPGMQDCLRVVLKSLCKRGFECRYVTFKAMNVGAPQTRNRWFLLGVRNGLRLHDWGVQPLSAEAIVHRHFPFWHTESKAPRQLDGASLTKTERRARIDRLKRLGNTVVPQMAMAAFELCAAGAASTSEK